MGIKQILRTAKRRILTGGYAEPVFTYLRDIRNLRAPFVSSTGKFTVNFSFDTEGAWCMPFWRKEPDETVLKLARKSRANLSPIVSFLRDERIPFGMQIVGALLDPELATVDRLLDGHQRELTRAHRDLFRLTAEEIDLIRTPLAEIGVHGLSHRAIDTLSRDETLYEMREACRLVSACFGTAPRWMSYPKNDVAHRDAIAECGLTWWRGDSQGPTRPGEMPVGLWYSPSILAPADLRRLLQAIREIHPGGLMLHLWGHFTEMSLPEFRAGVDVIRQEQFAFAPIPDPAAHA